MNCADGTGMFIGFTVTVDAFCRESGDVGEKLAQTQAFIRAHDDAITVASVVKVRSAGSWESGVESFDSGRADDGCGSLERKRKGCGRSNPPWSAVIEYNGEFPIEALIGAEGTIRRWNPDGSYREAYGWIAGAEVIPSQAPKEESLGRIDVQWEGGAVGDRGFVKMFNESDVEQFPALP